MTELKLTKGGELYKYFDDPGGAKVTEISKISIKS